MMRSDARKRDVPTLTPYDQGWTEGQTALADRIEAAIRFIGPDHITPSGERVLRSILRGRE